jgi:hypothetical protein
VSPANSREKHSLIICKISRKKQPFGDDGNVVKRLITKLPIAESSVDFVRRLTRRRRACSSAEESGKPIGVGEAKVMNLMVNFLRGKSIDPRNACWDLTHLAVDSLNRVVTTDSQLRPDRKNYTSHSSIFEFNSGQESVFWLLLRT